ncbi:histone deacetylase 8-like [Ischnura elegans]|uniref:histone deacetylase 8-like n=1 Tax=Ischnura elegans TaxID=197161 RepID=UPI001ED886BE|nr:histone deacetylase 8-like [Ischnura elegans]
MSSKVAYIKDDNLTEICSNIPNVGDRGKLTHRLVEAYGLFKFMQVFPVKPASREDLITFHSQSYVDFLIEADEWSDYENREEDQEEYGLGYDCPLFTKVYKFASLVAGGSLTGAQLLVDGDADIAINWCGGWHHAQRDEAKGFCYVNDIVIAIQKLREKFDRVLYIDIDAHHGDGVENAFSSTSKVMTVSFHNYGLGFFPGSGAVNDVGFGAGRYYSVNVPLKDGVTDDQFSWLFTRVMDVVTNTFHCDAVVLQCGADCLTGDPVGTFNLTPHGMGACVKKVLTWKLPTLFLGGGGYNLTNTAKCWTFLTSIIVGKTLSSDIPDHTDFLRYGPDFDLEISAGLRKNSNTFSELNTIVDNITANLSNLP